VNERLGVDVFNAGDELIGKEKDRLERELAVAKVEEILQAGSKEIDNHGIVVTFGTEPANERDSNTTGKRLVDTGFIFELRVLSLDTFKLDGNFLARDNVGACIKRSVSFPP
jgi:hypothetical protein